jgi:5-methyltetrahydrofolate--homocysteine methyltransferase
MDKLFDREFILLDGALGTMLQNSGMPVGTLPEVYALENPEIIDNIHALRCSGH